MTRVRIYSNKPGRLITTKIKHTFHKNYFRVLHYEREKKLDCYCLKSNALHYILKRKIKRLATNYGFFSLYHSSLLLTRKCVLIFKCLFSSGLLAHLTKEKYCITKEKWQFTNPSTVDKFLPSETIEQTWWFLFVCLFCSIQTKERKETKNITK